MLGKSCTSPLSSNARFCESFAPGELSGTSVRDGLSFTVPSEFTSVEMSELKTKPGLDWTNETKLPDESNEFNVPFEIEGSSSLESSSLGKVSEPSLPEVNTVFKVIAPE